MEIESYLNLNIFPQFFFQQRDSGKVVIGLGEIPLSQDFFARFQTLPTEYVFFYNQLFHGNKPYITLPRFQIEIENGATKVLSILKEKLPTETLKSEYSAPVVASRFDKPKKADWIDLFEGIGEGFIEGTFRKIVPSRKVTLNLEENVNIVEVFKKARKESNYNYMIRTSEHSAFFGSTPERLVHLEDTNLITEAIAGTRPLDRGHELLESEKELYEHQLVVEDIVSKLDAFSKSVKSEKVGLVEAKNLCHLKTKITATPEGKNIIQIIDALHPTSAVCGMPKRETMNFLRDVEPFDRGLFASPFGIFNREFADIAVAIRCCHVEKTKVELFSGVGVVPQSNPENEWNELEYKIQPYLDIFYSEGSSDL